ncbi:MAG: hypothetical protein HY231_04995 [Acidobacteria bacterium]|nr:hypothetical protein [Acidobacteriota bacterium]
MFSSKGKTVQQQVYVNEVVESATSPTATPSRFTRLVLCLLLSAVAVIPFYFFGRPQHGNKEWHLQMPITHDMHLHLEQMKSFYNGLAAGVIYPRWEEDTNRGFGAPTTSYYPPGIYYLTSAFYALSHHWLFALLCTHLLMMIASAVAFLLYIRQYVSPKAALLAMTAYIFLPYHLTDQYQRGAMAELLGFIWMPLMLYFGERLLRRRKVDENGQAPLPTINTLLLLAGLATTYSAFLWSHPPTAYQFSLAFGLYITIMAAMRKDFKGLLQVGCAIALGVLLAAAYLYPAAAEQDLIHHEYVSETWPYHSTYIFVHHLPYSEAGGFFRLLDATWIFGVLVVLVCGAFFFFFARRFAASELKEKALLWSLVGGFVSFMMIKYSAPLGRHIPKIDIGVFTWRMLAISTFVVAAFVGLCAHLGADKINLKNSQRLAFSVTAWVIVIGGSIFSIVAVARPMIYAPSFVPSPEHVNLAMIPYAAPESPLDFPHLDRALLTQGKGEVEIVKWLPQSRELRVVLSEPDTLFIRTFNFPGWTASVNGQPATLKTGAVLKEINLDLPAGQYDIKLDYLNTPSRQHGERATQIGALLLLLLLGAGVVQHIRSKKIEATKPQPAQAQR